MLFSVSLTWEAGVKNARLARMGRSIVRHSAGRCVLAMEAREVAFGFRIVGRILYDNLKLTRVDGPGILADQMAERDARKSAPADRQTC